MQLYPKFSFEKSIRPLMIFILNQNHSIANHMLRELRDKNIQQDRQRFRRNVEKLGSILAYEISRKLTYHPELLETPLGKSVVQVLDRQPALITVLRAGLPFFQGFLDFFDRADCGFIGAFREEGEEDISISLNYAASPSLEGRNVIMIDPMLATGKSFVKSVKTLLTYGRPAHIHIAALVSAPEGVSYIDKNIELPYTIWTCALDDRLDERSYIVPGLGDAGDLCYGEKV
jgi:uracil phosphoribosyltransferase